jgi:ligand-binding sensor domain-containing protein/two-component sensor histidine kinase
MSRLVLLLVSLVLSRISVEAQAPVLNFEKLTIENGLSNDKVNCILRDKRGFIWIGTNDGLNRYDGNNFVVFRHEPGKPSTTSGNIIKDMVEDKEGRLWIATEDGGLTRYDYRLPPSQIFKQYKHLPDDSSSIPVNMLNTLVIDSAGYIWLGTSGYRVLRFDPRTEQFIQPVKRGTRTILDLAIDKDGMLWAGKQGGGILKINPRDCSYYLDPRYDNLYAKLPHVVVTALYSDKENNMWYGSWDKVLYMQPPGQDQPIVFQKDNSPYSFQNDQIECFTEDDQGRLWMGGRYFGLHIYDRATKQFYNYRYDPAREGTVADNHVNCVYNDGSGRIWLGTDRGISIFQPSQQQFVQNFLPGNRDRKINIYDFYENANGDLWIGTSEGLYVRDARTKSFALKTFTYKGHKLAITKIYKDVDETIYFGTDYTLFRYDEKNNTLQPLPNSDKDTVMRKIIESRVVSIIRDTINNHPVLLVSPYGHFLSYYDLVEKRWVSRIDTTQRFRQRYNVVDNLIRKIYRCKRGLIWLATAKMGLATWTHDPLPNLEHLGNNPADVNTISNNNVYDIAEDNLGNLWISTYGGGLNRFDYATRKFWHISVTNNLLEGLQVDNHGYIWMISNGNLYRYHPLRNSQTPFDLPDIDKSGGVRGYIFKDSKGNMLAAGTGYFIEFDPLTVRADTNQPEVYLTDFKIFNQSYSDLLMRDLIELKHNQNYFRIEFAAPEFSTGRDIQYSYMLEGRDRNWIPIGRQNFEQFSNLPGGEYVFKVRATTSAGSWNNKITSVRIVIIPPFWTTWWFYAICAAVTALIIYTIYRYRINELLKRQAIRNKIAQDLHDNVGSTLSSISVYSQVAKIYNEQKRFDELQQTLEKIGITSGEMISEMNDIVWAINPRNDNMNTILQRMESYARPLLASQNIAFHFTADPNLKNMNLEMTRRKNFYLIFKEAVNNAMKYSRCNNIWVHIGIQQQHVVLTVKDDGVGFDLKQVHIHASQSLSGNGLRNMEMRAAEMKGTWKLESEPGKGTTVNLKFPIT